MNWIKTEVNALEPELIAHRRRLHAHPEVGFDLPETLAYVRNVLADMGIEARNCGRCGLVATLGRGEKTILLRADMDALPIPEESGEEFAAKNGAMHACGHDLHTAMLLGAAKILKRHEAELPGRVMLMFQSAEEIFEGAKDMIAHGLLEDPRPDAALMIHVTVATSMPTGMVILCPPGVSAPAADYFTIRVQGKGCHGSTPHAGVDALTAASHILLALQELHARELPPGTEAVLTVGTFRGGTAPNAIADSATLAGTIRTYSEDTREFLKTRMEEISASVAAAYRAQAGVEFGSGCPTLVNDAGLNRLLHGCLPEILGQQMVLNAADFPTPMRGGGSEDFAYISQQVPTLMLALAAGSSQQGYTHPLHHPSVRLDEAAMKNGTAALVASAFRFLSA